MGRAGRYCALLDVQTLRLLRATYIARGEIESGSDSCFLDALLWFFTLGDVEDRSNSCSPLPSLFHHCLLAAAPGLGEEVRSKGLSSIGEGL